MSLSETRQIYDLLVKIDAILSGINVKTAQVERDTPKLKQNLENFRELERVALRYLAITQKLGLPAEADRAITVLSQLIVVVRMLQISLNMLEKGTTYGLLMGVAGVILTGFSAYDVSRGGS